MTKLSALIVLAGLVIGSRPAVMAFSPTSNRVSKPAVRPLSSTYPQNPTKEFDLIAKNNDEWLQRVLGTENQRRVKGNAEGFLSTAAALILALTLAASGLGSTQEASFFDSAVSESPKEKVVQQYDHVVDEDDVQLLDQSAGFFFF